jgi:PHD/YefM family antitoxin component YafN of YafNO toxin-antitoxin module
MTSPQSLPVEEARKKFADLLDDSQFRSTHTAITRRGKIAGYVVPPEWYARAVNALAQATPAATEEAAQRPSPAVAAPRQQVTETVPEDPEPLDLSGISPEVAALSLERVEQLAATAEDRQPKWVAEIRAEYPDADGPRLCYLIVDVGFRMGRKPPELADAPTEPADHPSDEES